MNGRALFVVIVAAGVFVGLAARLFAVQVSDHAQWRARRDAQTRGFVDVQGPRGTIRDARGELLAVSVPVPFAYVDPAQVSDSAAVARALGVDAAAWADKTRRYVWIKRLTEEEAAQLLARRLHGVGVRHEYVRTYPHGSLAAHVLGMVNKKADDGLEGVEAALDDALAGAGGRVSVTVDGRRRRMTFPELSESGAHVDLTIDATFQRIVEEELDAACAEYRPNWAIAVAIEPSTGAVLAMANRPTFDPNLPAPRVAPGADSPLQNLAVIAPFEPGSTWKQFCVAGALEDGLLTPRTVFDCENGVWRYGPRTLRDHKPFGRLTVTEIMAKSSNIGVEKIAALVLGRERLWKWADAFGFGRATGIELPGEAPGFLKPLSKWTPYYTETSIPMGHEISATMLQVAAAASAIANRGRLMKPFVVRRITDAAGGEVYAAAPQVVRQVVSERTAAQVRDILVEAVKSGTGAKAAVEGVAVAGKSGTTQKYDRDLRAYTHTKHISSFVGFAPAEQPRVCVVIALDEPKGAYYGGAVAAPVVGNIIRRGLPHLR